MTIKHKVAISIAFMVLCCVSFGVVRADEVGKQNPGNAAGGDSQGTSYLEQLQKRPATARIAAQVIISKEITAEYESLLAWLKTRKTPFPFEENATEVLAIKLLSEVRWFGAVDFFIQNIVWHVRIPLAGIESIPKWAYFPCAMALMKFEGCELKIAKAALSAKRDIEMQLLCIVLIRMANVDAEKILVFTAGDEAELQPRLKAAQSFLKSFSLNWNPYDCKDFDDPFSPQKALGEPENDSTPTPPAGGEAAPSEENNTTLPASNKTPLVRDGSAPSATDTGRPSATTTSAAAETQFPTERRAEAAVAEAAPFPWAIVIVVAAAALAAGAITTILLTRAKKTAK